MVLAVALVLPPAPTARLNDYAGLLTPAERERIESLLTERERSTGTQMAIAVFKSLEGESLEDVANTLFQKWRLGQKKLDNGVLLVVFVQDRKLRLEVGYGLEAVLPDAEAAQIIRGAIAPRFREQNYAAGLEAATIAVYERIKPGSTPPEELKRGADASQRRPQSGSQNLYLLVFLAFVVLTVGGLAWDASHQRGYTAGRRGWGPSSGGWYGGGWGGGGGYSGGGGFGGGGGGFSGGGGSSGGGGASGGW